jgi:hypothetical protein
MLHYMTCILQLPIEAATPLPDPVQNHSLSYCHLRHRPVDPSLTFLVSTINWKMFLLSEIKCWKYQRRHVMISEGPRYRINDNHRHGSRHAAGSAVGWGTTQKVGRSRVRFPMVSLEFFIDIILPAALWPWSWLILKQKWVPGIIPGGKGGRYVGLTTLPPSCADCLEIWEPQPPGTLRACPGL